VGDKKPSLNTKVFEVGDQKLIKATIKGRSGLIGVVYTLNNFWAYEQYWAWISYLLKRLELLFGPK
jgi:hypothetical protein